MIHRKPKKHGASASALPFSKAKYSGQRPEIITAEQYQDLHKGKERDLQEAFEQLCGLYGWLPAGTVDKEGIPFDCPGVFFHIPDEVYRTAQKFPVIGRYLKNLPDNFLIRRDGALKLIELKRKDGRLRPGQRSFMRLIPVEIVKSSDHAEELIREFSKL